MATVEKAPRRTRDVAEASRRVLDPLQRLRGYIRTYVALEATAIVLLFVAASFWVSLLFDYGAFKMPYFHKDWVQELPRFLRVVLLAGFVAFVFAIIAAKAINRLIQRFRDVALALELERRFPKILGDRLITAVELSNRRKVLEQGYSQAMVDETIMEAAERVEKLPLKEVFRWGRLWVMYGLVVLLTFGLYALVLAGFCGVEYLQTRQASLAGAGEFHEVSGIWFERNVLLQNTIWPRRAYLQFLEPADATLRMGRDEPPPPIRVRAWQYVFAAFGTRDGWRGLQWTDLENNEKIAGKPAEPPGEKGKWEVRDPSAGLTVDEVALFFGKFDIRKGEPAGDDFVSHGYRSTSQWTIAAPTEDDPNGRRPLAWQDLNSEYLNGLTVPTLPASSRNWDGPREPDLGFSVDEVARESAARPSDPELEDVRTVLAHLETLAEMRKTLDRLDDRVADNSMRRTVRKLVIPGTVTVTVKGPSTTSTTTLSKLANNEYTGVFGELKDKAQDKEWDFSYYASGEDFSSADRYLTLVPPPSLVKVYRDDLRPAYLLYRADPDKDVPVEVIRGKKQPIERSEVSLMGGAQVPVDCPAGTTLTLVCEADKPLDTVTLTEPKNGPELKVRQKNGPELKVEAVLDGNTFTVTIPDVREEIPFEVHLVDKDGAKGVRAFKVRVQKDLEPQVDLSIAEWVRKTKDGYMVTPKARVPFTGKIEDDHGLSKVQYVYSVSKLESAALSDLKALEAGVASIMAGAPGGSGPLHGLTGLTRGMQLFDQAKNARPDREELAYYPGKNLSIKPFDTALRDAKTRPEEFLPANEIAKRLTEPVAPDRRKLLNRFELKPDVGADVAADFPLESANLLAAEGAAQPRYRVTLWVEATDTDLDSTKAVDGVDGPKVGASKERYVLLVVREDDLLVEIGKDEEKLSNDLAMTIDKLREVLDKVTQITSTLAGTPKPEEVAPLSVRTEALEQLLDQSHASTKEVQMKYETLLLEMRGNQIDKKKTDVTEREIVKPLREDIDRIEFPDAKEKLKKLHAALDDKDLLNPARLDAARKAAGEAREEINTLVLALTAILDKMQSEIDLKKVIEKIRKVQRDLENEKALAEAIKKEIERRLLEGATEPKNP
jgi:hypothetical protein